MGFDVTFHPISAPEIRHYVFDVFADPSLAEPRAAELTTDHKERDIVLGLYRQFPAWADASEPLGNTFSVAAAIFAGFLHPCWHARNTAITFFAEEGFPQLNEVFTSLHKMENSAMRVKSKFNQPMIFGNESASGFICPDKIGFIIDTLKFLEEPYEELLSLRACLKYCQQMNLGMIEASDIVVPIADRCMTRFSNLRAPFIGKIDP